MVTCPICNRQLGNMRITHLRKHGYNSWDTFLADYPTFEDVEWKKHSQRASRQFWDKVTSEQISQRKEKQLATWYAASEKEQEARKTRRSHNVKKIWETLDSDTYVKRCKNIGDGFLAATTKEQRSAIARKAKSCNPPDQAQRCSLGMKKYWEDLTDKEYYELCQERSRFWSKMPLDEYDMRCAEFKALWESRPNSEKEKLREVYRKNIRKSFGCKESWIEKVCKKDLEKLGYSFISQFSSLFLDLYVPEVNLAIELYGTYWHCDPRRTEAAAVHPHRKIAAHTIWEKDNQKQSKVLMQHNLLVIWERDYSIETLIQGIQALNLNLASPNGYRLWTSLTPSNQDRR